MPRFGAFWAIFWNFSEKVENPLPRESNPRLPPYLEGDMTATPGPRLCCRGTTPEPPGLGFGRIIRSSFLSGSGFGPAGSQVWPLLGDRPRRPYPRACKSGAYPRKKADSAGIGLRPGPTAGKVHGHSCHSARATGSILVTSAGLRARILPYSYLTLPCISRKSFPSPM